MKKIFLFAAAVAMFTACSNSDEVAQAPQVGQSSDFTQGDVAVGFDVYAQRATAGRRAGKFGEMDLTALQSEGFGVFGYYTDNNDYDQTSTPNFMYNEKVTYDATLGVGNEYWKYSPVKYWPNEYGSSAISEDQDRITFFAYAPYVAVIPTTGKIDEANATNGTKQTGIVGLSRNSAAGDPMVKYVVSLNPAECVDLLWGVAGDEGGSGKTVWNLKDGSTQNMTAGFPWTNVQRPGTTSKMKFTFDHALASLAVNVKAAISNPKTGDTDLPADTKIFIRSISFTGFTTRGALNLNNTDGTADVAKWLSYDGNTEIESGQEVTIFDGRKDGKEGTTAASNEKVTGLNAQLIQSKTWDAETATGVTTDYQGLFASDAPIYVIPTGEAVKVTIVYDVLTADGKLLTYLNDGKTNGSVIKNTITNDIKVSGANMELANGNKYIINLILGLNGVKFDAEVTPWETPAITSDDINLPEN